jgi:carboxymethylenebutenolidase
MRPNAINEWKVETPDGTIPCLVVVPPELPAPAVIVMATLYGPDREFEEILLDYAQLGFITVGPDQFWRTLPGPLPHLTEEQRIFARERYKTNDFERGVGDLRRVVDAVRAMPECTGEYGITGYCFGGRYAYVAAARLGAKVAISFHGSDIGHNLADAAAINVPISLHYGDSDHHAPMSEIESIRKALAGNPRAEVVIYPGAGHGFTSPTKPTWDAVATAKSRQRAQQLLVENLRAPVRSSR